MFKVLRGPRVLGELGNLTIYLLGAREHGLLFSGNMQTLASKHIFKKTLENNMEITFGEQGNIGCYFQGTREHWHPYGSASVGVKMCRLSFYIQQTTEFQHFQGTSFHEKFIQFYQYINISVRK